MPGPLHNVIKGTTAGAPGTGAFTPNAASAGFLAWSTAPSGWWGMVRFEDGSAWSIEYCYWNATTLSRASTQFVSSSTGAHLSLTSAATAALVADGNRVNPHPITQTRLALPLINSAAAPSAIGFVAGTLTGTAAAAALAATNYLTEQPRIQLTSATTANAQAGYSHTTVMVLSSTAAGRGGWEFSGRFGVSGLPTGPRLFAGMTATTFVANAGEPSALVANYAVFAKDSTDTNIQLLTNSNAGAGTKIDTGIALVVDAFYEARIWTNPGSTTVFALLVRMDTGAIFYTSTAADVPANGALLMPQALSGLSATTGVAIVFHFGGYTVRPGGI